MDSAPHITTKSPRFMAFLAGQALGAANDNAIKITITAFVIQYIAKSEQIFYSGIITAILPIAFLMFSPFAGYLADRYPKNRILFFSKSPEILAMLVSCVGLYLESLPILLVSFFLMSMQSAFFGPAKYGILPEVLDKENLSMANGLVNMTTNIAILLGAVLGSLLYDVFKGQLAWAGLIYTGIAFLGAFVIYFSPKTHPGNKNAPFQWNFISCLWSDFHAAAKIPPLLNAVWGISFFYALGALFMAVIPIYGSNVLGLDPSAATMMLAVLTIGIAVGSILVGFLSRTFIEIGWVPVGCFGLAIFALDMATFGDTGSRTWNNFTVRSIIDLLFLGVSSGFFIVPLIAQLQAQSPHNQKGRFVAFMNIMSFAGILAAALIVIFFSGMDPRDIIFAVGMVTLTVAFLISVSIPDLIMRVFIVNVLNFMYRIRVIHPENRPKKGILVPNHISWIDPFLIGSCCEKMLCYLMYRSFYEMQPTNWCFKKLSCIPVSGGDTSEKKQQSLDIARNFIESGKPLCIFPEGKISRVGNLLPYKNGFERIAKEIDCEVIPVCVDSLWGSIFTYSEEKYFLKKPKKFSSSVNIIFGKPLPSNTTAFEARIKVQELSAEAYKYRLDNPLPLHIQFAKVANKNKNKIFIRDTKNSYTYGEIFKEVLSLKLGFAEGKRVAVVLPPKEAIIVNLALLFKNCIPVNLAPQDTIANQMKTLEISDIVLNKDVLSSYKLGDSIKDFNKIFFAEIEKQDTYLTDYHKTKAQNKNCDTELTFYFNQDNKAIPITHRNIYTNIKTFYQTNEIHEDTILCTELFHHPFAFVANFWLPALYAQEIACNNDADNYDAIMELNKNKQLSVVFMGEARLQEYLENLGGDFKPRYLGVIGENVSEDMKEQYKQKFDIDLMWLFAMAECGPFVTLNRIDFIDEENYNNQFTTRAHSVGLPLPEVAVKIVDANRKDLGENEEGIMLVKGANVFEKYLGDVENKAYFQEGWFITNKKAKIDDKGFIYIL